MKKIITTALVVLLTSVNYAQQNPQYSQYIFNMMVINPAYAGSKEVFNLNGLYRKQWSGLEGAPLTQTISADAAAGKAVGLGLYVTSDKLGAQAQTAFLANFSYRLQFNDKARLSFGLSGGATQFSIDGNKLSSDVPDPGIPVALENRLIPDAKGGLFFNTQKFYAGLSVSGLFATVPIENQTGIINRRHYFFTTGYVFDLGEHFKFKPGILIKEDFKGPTTTDLNAFILIFEKVWMGASYRTGIRMPKRLEQDANSLNRENAVALITEFYASEKFRIGYAYDVTGSALRDYGSHEFSLGYFFNKKQNTKMITPRYF